MPIYEYECDACHEVFEVRQKLSDPPPTSHSCGSTQVHRILSATSFVLKGTGWYATDYGNRRAENHKEGKAAEPGKKAEGSGGDAPASGSERPPAPAKAAAPEAKPSAAAAPATQAGPQKPAS